MHIFFRGSGQSWVQPKLKSYAVWKKTQTNVTVHQYSNPIAIIHTGRMSGSIGRFNRNPPTFGQCVLQPGGLTDKGLLIGSRLAFSACRGRVGLLVQRLRPELSGFFFSFNPWGWTRKKTGNVYKALDPQLSQKTFRAEVIGTTSSRILI